MDVGDQNGQNQHLMIVTNTLRPQHPSTYFNFKFFMVGNPLYFFDQLGDETLFRVIPNQGHGGVAGGRNIKLKRNELPFQNNRKWSSPKY